MPTRRVKAFPHEFSGGMRQRAMIAMAIANNPRLIIADEPTTALDVTIQAQILEVLEEAKRITGAAVSLITHDLGVVAGHADRVAVMYAGKLVELGDVDQVFHEPTCRTRSACCARCRTSSPRAPSDSSRSRAVRRRSPALPAGCPFAARCPVAIPKCTQVEPELVQHGHDPDSHQRLPPRRRDRGAEH